MEKTQTPPVNEQIVCYVTKGDSLILNEALGVNMERSEFIADITGEHLDKKSKSHDIIVDLSMKCKSPNEFAVACFGLGYKVRENLYDGAKKHHIEAVSSFMKGEHYKAISGDMFKCFGISKQREQELDKLIENALENNGNPQQALSLVLQGIEDKGEYGYLIFMTASFYSHKLNDPFTSIIARFFR